VGVVTMSSPRWLSAVCWRSLATRYLTRSIFLVENIYYDTLTVGW